RESSPGPAAPAGRPPLPAPAPGSAPQPPCRRSAAPPPRSPPADRRVVGHQLALGPVAGKADDNYPPRLDAGHDAVPKARMNDVVADPQLKRGARLDHLG